MVIVFERPKMKLLIFSSVRPVLVNTYNFKDLELISMFPTPTQKGLTALDHARNQGNQHCVELLTAE